MRHRAAELGERCTYVRADSYAEGLSRIDGTVTVCHPTSRAALRFAHPEASRFFLRAASCRRRRTSTAGSGPGRRRLLMEDFYRESRRRTGVLMDGNEPGGDRWNFDADNREPPPCTPTLGVPGPWWPQEDEIDEEVRRDLDRWERDGDVSFLGSDGPRRFAATRSEADAALDHFITDRLPHFGPHEDAMLSDDQWMAHSLLSRADEPGSPRSAGGGRTGRARPSRRSGALASVEVSSGRSWGGATSCGTCIGTSRRPYRGLNELDATEPLPEWFANLRAIRSRHRA